MGDGWEGRLAINDAIEKRWRLTKHYEGSRRGWRSGESFKDKINRYSAKNQTLKSLLTLPMCGTKLIGDV